MCERMSRVRAGRDRGVASSLDPCDAQQSGDAPPAQCRIPRTATQASYCQSIREKWAMLPSRASVALRAHLFMKCVVSYPDPKP